MGHRWRNMGRRDDRGSQTDGGREDQSLRGDLRAEEERGEGKLFMTVM